MIRKDIALDIKEHLGDKYRIYVDNNNNEFIDIENDMNVEKQLNLYNDKISCLFSTTVGEVVALKDIFSTSFSYSLSFWVPQQLLTQAYNDIYKLIAEMNGMLHDRTEYRYVITFNMPFTSGTQVVNGVFYNIITLSGNISHSDYSLYGNDFKISINDEEVNTVINHNIKMHIEHETKQKEGSFFPGLIKKYAVNTLQLTLHLRKDESIALQLSNLCCNPELLGTPFVPPFKIVINRPTQHDVVWEAAELISAEQTASIGSYVILSVVFLRTVEL